MAKSTEKAPDGWEYTIQDDDSRAAEALEDIRKHGIHIVLGIREDNEDPDRRSI